MSEIDSQDDAATQVTTITKSSLKRGLKNVPIMPKIHAQAIIDLGKHSTRYLLGVALHLSLHLTKENPDTVVLQAHKISDELGLSEPSVLKAIKLLEDLGYIKCLGKSLYYISPTLAHYGTAIEWSLALQIEDDGGALDDIREAKARINAQIKENEIAVGVH